MALTETEVEVRAWLDRLAIQDLIYRYSDASNPRRLETGRGTLRFTRGLGSSGDGTPMRRRCSNSRDADGNLQDGSSRPERRCARDQSHRP